ncbi:MAG: hypothetical protein WC686_02175 [Candidatus Shapirobacteria bacterium]|jgi:hypothetical protein
MGIIKLWNWLKRLFSGEAKKGLVIIIPGLFGLNGNLTRLVKIIRSWGYEVELMPKNICCNWKIEKIAQELAIYINNKGAEKIFLIGHSKGGLVARYLVGNYEEIEKKIGYVFTIATPHKGTFWGVTPLRLISQLNPTGDFIINLNKNKKNEKVVNFYAKLDTKIVPKENAILEGGQNYKVNIVGHTRIIKSKELVGYLKNFLVT